MNQVLTRRLTERSREHDIEAASEGAAEDPKVSWTRTLEDEIDELNAKQLDDWARWEGVEHDIVPHTDAGGDAYSIGDAYEGIKCAHEWRISNPGPYLRYVKHISETWPHLKYLAHWMEVTCAPPKWKYMRHFPANREERSKKTNVCVIDFTTGQPTKTRKFRDATKLKDGLEASPQSTSENQTRLIVVEDLSRDLVETLGAYYDVDPLFFLSYIGDYLFHNTRDPWAELPNLDVDLRKQNHFILQYLRARYFLTEEEFQAAEKETGKWNILRRLDSDRSRKRLQKGLLDKTEASSVLTRAKTSLWVKPRKNHDPVTGNGILIYFLASMLTSCAVAILLVDPTVTHGKALWDGYRPFEGTPSMAAWNQDPGRYADAPTRDSLFADIIYWSQRMGESDLLRVQKDPRCIALPMYRLVVADWLTTLKYMTTQLGKIEWEFESPHWGENPGDIDSLLKKLSPWRRNVGYYQTMISEATSRLFPPAIHAPYHGLQGGSPDCNTEPLSPSPETLASGTEKSGILALYVDFQNVKRQMDEIQVRIKSIENMATNNINIEESRRAVKQNKNLARLTFLASLFIPLQFTSSFLSISPDFTKAKTSIWLFFVIGIPLTLIALLAIELTHPTKDSWTWKRVKASQKWYAGKFAKKPPPANGRLPQRTPTPPTATKPDLRQRRQSAVTREKRLSRSVTTTPWVSTRQNTKYG